MAQLPSNFPPWKTVHEHFRAWRDSGVWERVGKALREQGRQAKGRKATPTVAIVDSQSAKTVLNGGDAVTTRARRSTAASATSPHRHIAVDTEGNLLAVIVHSAGIQDRVAARAVLLRLFCRFGLDHEGLRRWRLYGQADRLGPRDVRIQRGGGQTQ